MTMKMYHCITVTVLTATAGKTVKVGKKSPSVQCFLYSQRTCADDYGGSRLANRLGYVISSQFLFTAKLPALTPVPVPSLTYSVTLSPKSQKISIKGLSAHVLSQRLMKATSSSHWDIMAYVDRDRTPGMSTTKKAPPVISIVRMASVSINVLQSTPSVSYFFQD